MKKSLVLLGIFALVLPLVFLGCEGDDGAQGPPGPPGSGGVGTTAVNPESCAICHDDDTVRDGDAHQADYDERFQDNVVVVSNIAYSFADNTHTVTFTMQRRENGVLQDFDCSETATEAPEDSLGIYFTQYDNTAMTWNAPPPLTSRLSLGTQGSASTPSTLTYLGAGVCESTVAAGAEGDLADNPGLIVIYGRDDRQGTLLSPSRVVLAIHPFAGIEPAPAGTFDIGDYVSPATVDGCEKCHTVPFLKHGYIYGRVNGDPATDFYTCKACHLDSGEGGHFIWQLLVDNPQRAAELVALYEASADPRDDESDFMTPAELAQYAYTTKLMNDVHMSHAMEFAYPQSMGNCATCHAGKLDLTLTDNNFVIETCKSCHPVTGGTDLPDADGDFTVDTRTTNGQKSPLNRQAPALVGLLPASIGAHAAPFTTQPCNDCHSTSGFAPVFSEIHTGYDPVIYGTDNGVKYSERITVSIDNASFVDNNYALSFSVNASGSLGAADSADIVPTMLVGLYGFDTKDFLFGPHERDANRDRFLEATAGETHPRLTITSPAAGSWNVTADLSMWSAWIDNGSVHRVEIGVMPTLELASLPADDNVIALNAVSRTFNLNTGSFEPNFHGNRIVRVEEGAVGGYVSGCNNCHDALATTFHSPNRGGSVVVCRMCHITKSPGSHLELQSRSIDSYAHAIHRFQAFDTGGIDFNDPVEALEYTHHVQSNFPTFTIENCRACHNAGEFNVPDQLMSLPGVLAGDNFATIRNIGEVPEFITGPATRACGACHRAEAIIANEGFGDGVQLANINSHMATFGYLVETSSATREEDLFRVIDEIFSALTP